MFFSHAGKVTSLVAEKHLDLANKIKEVVTQSIYIIESKSAMCNSAKKILKLNFNTQFYQPFAFFDSCSAIHLYQKIYRP